MPKVKTLLIILLVITFSFSLLGCGLIASRTASTDEVVEVGGQIPEWLLLSHRSIASEESNINEDLAARDEDEEADEAVGGVDEEDQFTADSSQSEQTTSEAPDTASSDSPSSTEQQQPSTDQQQTPSAKSEQQQLLEKIVPGTREHLFYLNNRKPGESKEEFVKRYFEEKANAEEEEETGDWFHDRESPSGWGG